MAKAVITDIQDKKLSRIKSEEYPIAKIIDPSKRTVKINYVMPFRIKFTTLGIESYGPNNPAPIGIAIIGFNNYIL